MNRLLYFLKKLILRPQRGALSTSRAGQTIARPDGEDSRDAAAGFRSRYQQLLQDYHIQGQLLEVSNRILASGYGASTLEEAFSSVINICMQAIGGDTSVIELLDEEAGVLVGVATDSGVYRPEG